LGLFVARPSEDGILPAFEIWHFPNQSVSKCVFVAIGLETVDEDLTALEAGSFELLAGRWNRDFVELMRSLISDEQA
jgi:hypothetical protein